MIINWLTAKAQQFLPTDDAELDELSSTFDFALSDEIMGLLYAHNQQSPQAETAESAITRFALDEHELALA